MVVSPSRMSRRWGLDGENLRFTRAATPRWSLSYALLLPTEFREENNGYALVDRWGFDATSMSTRHNSARTIFVSRPKKEFVARVFTRDLTAQAARSIYPPDLLPLAGTSFVRPSSTNRAASCSLPCATAHSTLYQRYHAWRLSCTPGDTITSGCTPLLAGPWGFGSCFMCGHCSYRPSSMVTATRPSAANGMLPSRHGGHSPPS